MNRMPVAGLVLLLACTAYAGGNPDARIYIDFDPPDYVHEIAPELYTTIEADIYLDQLGDGMQAVSFRFTNLQTEYPGVFAPPTSCGVVGSVMSITCRPESPTVT